MGVESLRFYRGNCEARRAGVVAPYELIGKDGRWEAACFWGIWWFLRRGDGGGVPAILAGKLRGAARRGRRALRIDREEREKGAMGTSPLQV